MKDVIGVCLGASTISIVKTKALGDKIEVIGKISEAHNGNPKAKIEELLFDFDPVNCRIVFTGRKFRKSLAATNISEPEATEYALDYIKVRDKKISAAISLGGETFMMYQLEPESGKISNVITKNQCASGTGEFFLQQLKRMDLNIDEAVQLAQGAEPHKVSGRCSVFCKSDCTHALNKGIAKSEVTAGLAKMTAEKIEELLSKAGHGNILLCGGVTKNKVVMDFLNLSYPNCQIADYADCFEALGASLYGHYNETDLFQSYDELFIQSNSSFSFHKPLRDFENKVSFKETAKRRAVTGERCYLGLDVGSTTTKAVIIAESDNKTLADIYLYTNGNPIKAARDCYAELSKQIVTDIKIIGLGTTGSGRQIAGLHALTNGIFNEIVAHAAAAVYFDPEVDTIFEIGGQDAKYTYIVNKVPADYAMNEACSAGTGSFIEEAAWESLGIKVSEIEAIAMNGNTPPNFSDQCAAFISSDIKTAQQEGIGKDDIIAGLVYSICMNYTNRVKGNRTIGKKIFMQGGVCYNKAIPIAMAALTGIDIIVPPNPGLMGAFGVALEIKEKILLGLEKEGDFNLNELASREVEYKEPFICMGGNEKCDLRCSINLIEVQGKKYPFGGACNKYYNLKQENAINVEDFDFVKIRQEIVFNKYASAKAIPQNAKTIGINNSFHTHTLYPLFHNFFSELGFEVVLSDEIDQEGAERELTSFCYPAQISIGLFHNLLMKKCDYYFLPGIFEMPVVEDGKQRLDFNCTCVFVSGETYFLKQAYKDFDLEGKLLTPSLNFGNGYERELSTFIELGKQIGVSDKEIISDAFSLAVEKQKQCQNELFKIGATYLDVLSKSPDKYAVVLIGRPYNSFTDLANKGIPRKFASRGIPVIPYDMIDFREAGIDNAMYWESGKKILKSAKIVKDNKQLFAVYISNFSCAPDSMIMSQFRNIMGTKPSLTLELDSHSADAGINTRIDAAIDIINNYRKHSASISDKDYSDFTPAQIEFSDSEAWFVRSDGKKLPLNDKSVEILIPSMGDLAAELFAASLRSLGFNCKALPEDSDDVLRYGKSHATGKECLPVILLAGALLNYIENIWDGKTNLVLFNIQGAGNCRLGQYPVFLNDMIKKKRLENVVQMILMNEDGFAGLGSKFALRGIQAIIASDVLDDIRSAVMANASDPDTGITHFKKAFSLLCNNFENTPDDIYKHLDEFSKYIANNVPVKIKIEDSKYIALLGEIYVRRDAYAHKWLNKTFAKKGFVVKDAYISEWIFYVDYLIDIDLLEPEKSIKKKFERYIRNFFMRDAEKKIKKTLEKSLYYKYEKTDIEPLLKHSKHILPWEFKGEPGLTIGTALSESIQKYCGIINLGPFGCMPTRFAEAAAVPEMNIDGKIKAMKLNKKEFKHSHIFNGQMNIPFLTIETDGSVYPQIIEAKLETFTLQAERMAHLMKQNKNGVQHEKV